jgi:hypothetical protein
MAFFACSEGIGPCDFMMLSTALHLKISAPSICKYPRGTYGHKGIVF